MRQRPTGKKMAQLIVRNLPSGVVESLRRRAAEHGRSVEAEHRELLREALLAPRVPSLKEHLLAMPAGGEDDDFDIERDLARNVTL